MPASRSAHPPLLPVGSRVRRKFKVWNGSRECVQYFTGSVVEHKIWAEVAGSGVRMRTMAQLKVRFDDYAEDGKIYVYKPDEVELVELPGGPTGADGADDVGSEVAAPALAAAVFAGCAASHAGVEELSRGRSAKRKAIESLSVHTAFDAGGTARGARCNAPARRAAARGDGGRAAAPMHAGARAEAEEAEAERADGGEPQAQPYGSSPMAAPSPTASDEVGRGAHRAPPALGAAGPPAAGRTDARAARCAGDGRPQQTPGGAGADAPLPPLLPLPPLPRASPATAVAASAMGARLSPTAGGEAHACARPSAPADTPGAAAGAEQGVGPAALGCAVAAIEATRCAQLVRYADGSREWRWAEDAQPGAAEAPSAPAPLVAHGRTHAAGASLSDMSDDDYPILDLVGRTARPALAAPSAAQPPACASRAEGAPPAAASSGSAGCEAGAGDPADPTTRADGADGDLSSEDEERWVSYGGPRVRT